MERVCLSLVHALSSSFSFSLSLIRSLSLSLWFRKCFLVFIVVWELLIYYPVCHWIWGGGFLHALGVIDFAGG